MVLPPKKWGRHHSCSDCQNKSFTPSKWKKHLHERKKKYQREWGRAKYGKLKPDPKRVLCWRCQKEFDWEYFFPTGSYLARNRWNYWTEQETDKEKYICDGCLIAFYWLQKPEYLNSIKNLGKRSTLNLYVVRHHNEFISKDTFTCDKDYCCLNNCCHNQEGCGRKLTIQSIVDPATPQEPPHLLQEM